MQNRYNRVAVLVTANQLTMNIPNAFISASDQEDEMRLRGDLEKTIIREWDKGFCTYSFTGDIPHSIVKILEEKGYVVKPTGTVWFSAEGIVQYVFIWDSDKYKSSKKCLPGYMSAKRLDSQQMLDSKHSCRGIYMYLFMRILFIVRLFKVNIWPWNDLARRISFSISKLTKSTYFESV